MDFTGIFKFLIFFLPVMANTEETTVSTAIFKGQQKKLRVKEKCSAENNALDHRVKRILNPLTLEGHWVSEKCELISGTKFILRDYQLDKSGIFQIHHYEYFDRYCTKPYRGYTVTGKIFGLQKTSSFFGGQNTDFAVSRVTAVPYDDWQGASVLDLALRQNCPNFDWSISMTSPLQERTIFQKNDENFKHWTGQEDYENFDSGTSDQSSINAPKSIDCLQPVNFTFLALNLVRMDEILNENLKKQYVLDENLKNIEIFSEKSKNFEFSGKNDQEAERVEESFFAQHRLYFGRPIWDRANKTFLPPTSFDHHPLIELNQVRNCKICEKIRDANQLNPPILKPPNFSNDQSPSTSFFSYDQSLNGDWLSADCESYVNGFYGFRMLTFRTAKANGRRNRKRDYKKWRLRQSYFTDPLCRQISHTVTAGGRYELTTDYRENEFDGFWQNSAVPVREISYKTASVQVIPKSRKFLTRKNRFRRSCQLQKSKWRLNVASDVTKSRDSACYSDWLGFVVPPHTNDVVYLTVDPANPQKIQLLTGNGQSSGDFAPPLLKCDEFTVRLMLHTVASELTVADDRKVGRTVAVDRRLVENLSFLEQNDKYRNYNNINYDNYSKNSRNDYSYLKAGCSRLIPINSITFFLSVTEFFLSSMFYYM